MDEQPLNQKPQVALVQAPAEASAEQASLISLNDVERVWPDLIARIKQTRMSIGMFLSEAEPVEVSGQKVTFGLPNEFKFHKETLEQQNNLAFIQNVLADLLGAKPRVEFVITEEEKVEKQVNEAANEAADSEVISSALQIFEGSKIIRKT